MSSQRTQTVGLFLILGAAIGFTLGLILVDVAMAAIFGALGAGLGTVIGAIVDLATHREPDSDRQR